MGYLTNLDNRIRGVDGVFILCIYLHSFDQDVQFENNLTTCFMEKITRSTYLIMGRRRMPGPLVAMWLPFYILAHGLTLCLMPFWHEHHRKAIGVSTMPAYTLQTLCMGHVCLNMRSALIELFFSIAGRFCVCDVICHTADLLYLCVHGHPLPSLFITALFFYVWLNKKIHPLTPLSQDS